MLNSTFSQRHVNTVSFSFECGGGGDSAAVSSHRIVFNMFSVFAVWGLKMFRFFVPVLLLLGLLTCSAQNTGESTGESVAHAVIVISAFTRHFLLFNFSKHELELMTNYYFFVRSFCSLWIS